MAVASQVLQTQTTSSVIPKNTTNANRFITFVDSGSGSYSRAKVDAALTYNPSTNTLTAGDFNSTSDIALKQTSRQSMVPCHDCLILKVSALLGRRLVLVPMV